MVVGLVLDLDLLVVDSFVDLWATLGLSCPKGYQILQIFQPQASIDPPDAHDSSHSLPQETLAA